MEADQPEHTLLEFYTALEESAIAAADKSLREGFSGPPSVHAFIDETYAGYSSTRPYRRGEDAFAAISGLGRFPATLLATSVFLAWDEADLRASFGQPTPDSQWGVATVVADMDGHSLVWHPYQPLEDGKSSATGLPAIRAQWGIPVSSGAAVLPPPIQRLLDIWRSEWSRMGSVDVAAELNEMIRLGYRVRLVGG